MLKAKARPTWRLSERKSRDHQKQGKVMHSAVDVKGLLFFALFAS